MNKKIYLLIPLLVTIVWQIINAYLYVNLFIDGYFLFYYSIIPFAIMIIYAIVKYGYLTSLLSAIICSGVSGIFWLLFEFEYIDADSNGGFFGLGYFIGLLVSIISPIIITLLSSIIKFIIVKIKNNRINNEV